MKTRRFTFSLCFFSFALSYPPHPAQRDGGAGRAWSIGGGGILSGASVSGRPHATYPLFPPRAVPGNRALLLYLRPRTGSLLVTCGL